MPGIDTNVTPDSEVPIIPKATTYHGEERLARKKVSESVFRLVRYDINIRIQK